MDEKNRIVNSYVDEEDIPAMMEQMKKVSKSFQDEFEKFDFLFDESDGSCTNTIEREGMVEVVVKNDDCTESLLEIIKQKDAYMYQVINNLLKIIVEKMSIKTEILPTKVRDKKVSDTEKALLEVVGRALNKLDTSKRPEKQINPFLEEIGMSTEEAVKDSFIEVCSLDKISYPCIINRLIEKRCDDNTGIYLKGSPSYNKEYATIKRELKNAFKEWLTQYQNLLERCPRISFINLLRLFAKKFAN